MKDPNNTLFSSNYLAWASQSDLPPLTSNQHRLAEMLLEEDNAKVVSQIGNMEEVFISVRSYLKSKKITYTPFMWREFSKKKYEK